MACKTQDSSMPTTGSGVPTPVVGMAGHRVAVQRRQSLKHEVAV